MKHFIVKFISILSGFLLFIIIFASSIEFATFNSFDFFKKEYNKLKVAESIKISENDLMVVTKHLLNYMQDKQPDLVVFAKINGTEKEFFNQKEKDHMIDVKNLFTVGFKVRNISIIIFIISIIALIAMKEYKSLDKTYIYIFCFMFLVLGGLVIIISTDFDKYFTIFHEMFFTNDLWLLDPKTDLLINLVPLQFFVDISIRIITTFFLSSIALLGGTKMLLK